MSFSRLLIAKVAVSASSDLIWRGSTYVSLSLRLLFPLRLATSSAEALVSSLLSSIARLSCSSSS